jgi:protein TonB
LRGWPVEARIPAFLALSALLHAGLLAGPWGRGQERPPAIEVVLGGPACKTPSLLTGDKAGPEPVRKSSGQQDRPQEKASKGVRADRAKEKGGHIAPPFRRKNAAPLNIRKPSRVLVERRAEETGPRSAPGYVPEIGASAAKKMVAAPSGRSQAEGTSGTSLQAPQGAKGLERAQGSGAVLKAGHKASHKTSRKGNAATSRQGLEGYLSRIRQIIEGNKRYPRRARRLGWQGAVRVSFTVLEDGTITGIELEAPCRYGELNRAAIRTVRQSSPLPAPPREILRKTGAPLRIGTTIRFQLR